MLSLTCKGFCLIHHLLKQSFLCLNFSIRFSFILPINMHWNNIVYINFHKYVFKPYLTRNIIFCRDFTFTTVVRLKMNQWSK